MDIIDFVKKKCSHYLTNQINCFDVLQNNWFGFIKSNNVKRLVKCKVCNVTSWSPILPDQLATLQTLHVLTLKRVRSVM